MSSRLNCMDAVDIIRDFIELKGGESSFNREEIEKHFLSGADSFLIEPVYGIKINEKMLLFSSKKVDSESIVFYESEHIRN